MSTVESDREHLHSLDTRKNFARGMGHLHLRSRSRSSRSSRGHDQLLARVAEGGPGLSLGLVNRGLLRPACRDGDG